MHAAPVREADGCGVLSRAGRQGAASVALVRGAIRGQELFDTAHVLPCFRIGRHAAIAIDRALAGVVGSGHAQQVAGVASKQEREIGRAALDVLRGIECVGHAETPGGGGWGKA